MTIGQLSESSGVPASTIRYWERLGVLPHPPRVGGQRRYGQDAAHRLAVIQLAQSCGFRLEETRQLTQGFRSGAAPSNRWSEMARGKEAEIDAQVARLLTMRELLKRVRACRCVDWNECGRMIAGAVKSKASSRTE